MQARSIRLLGLTMERVTEFRNDPSVKNAGFYAALDRRYQVVDVLRPTLSRLQTWMHRIQYIHPDRERWRFRTVLSLQAFEQRTRRAEQLIEAQANNYDLIVQLHTIMAPGLDPARRNFILHTDNTYQISERLYPIWAPLRGQQRERWLDHERSVYRNAAFLFPRTEMLRRSLIEDYGCDPDRIAVVGYGASFLAPSLEQRQYDSQVALFVGYDFRRKGGEVLLRAWPEVHRRLPQARLKIVGPKSIPTTTPLPEGVELLGPVRDRTLLGNLYKESATFVMASLFEPSGNVYLEAMGHGLPVIASHYEPMPEIVTDGATGLLVPPGNHEALAEALVAILGEPQRAEEMGRRAYQRVKTHFTWDLVVERMAPYIEQVVAAQYEHSNYE
jgi:glycosyltransferase involved in cell wall biosynthesis